MNVPLPLRYWTVGILLIVFLSACRIDTSSAFTAVLDTSTPAEALFMLEYSEQIQQQANLSEIGREACHMGYVKVARFLHSLGAEFNVYDDTGWNPLLFAARRGDLDTLRFLVEETGADIRARTHERVTALMLATLGGNLELSSYLIDRGANINAKTNSNVTPIMYAAASGNVAIVELLLERGALLPIIDNAGLNAANYAANKEISKILAAHGLEAVEERTKP